jgi:Rad3-related DNA helicase
VLTDIGHYSTDFLKLYDFCAKSDLTRKLNGFITAEAVKQGEQRTGQSVLYSLREFVRVLSLNPKDGLFILHFAEGNASIEYICLNPAVHLNRILDQVSKLLLTSGTLEPAGDFAMISQGESKWSFSCGHVVSKENFQAICVGEGFSFVFDRRDDQA